MEFNKEELWILYRLTSYHLNNICELSTELEIRPPIDSDFTKYIGNIEKVEDKIIKEYQKLNG